MPTLNVKDKSGLGYFLIGKHVGYKYDYTDNESKNKRSITILANRRTDESVKIDRAELDAEIDAELKEDKSLNK